MRKAGRLLSVLLKGEVELFHGAWVWSGVPEVLELSEENQRGMLACTRAGIQGPTTEVEV